MTEALTVLPGVTDLLDEALSHGVPCAVASSSESSWVCGYLDRFEIADRFAAVVTRDMVPRPKPAPDLYVEACRRLGAKTDECVALEDSVNGVTAARAAGLYCVAVPNPVTTRFALDRAHYIAPSLSEVRLETIDNLLASELSKARSSAR